MTLVVTLGPDVDGSLAVSNSKKSGHYDDSRRQAIDSHNGVDIMTIAEDRQLTVITEGRRVSSWILDV